MAFIKVDKNEIRLEFILTHFFSFPTFVELKGCLAFFTNS